VPYISDPTPSSTSRFKSSLIIRVSATLIVVTGLFLVGVANRSTIKSQLDAWKLLPGPERLTEVYFSRPSSLSATYTPGTVQNVAFTLDNLEYRTTTYNYRIVQTATGKPDQTLGDGSISLPEAQTKSFAVPVTPVNLGANSAIEVEITFQGIPFGGVSLTTEHIDLSYPVVLTGAAS
jgi:hypothetical protein